MNRTGAPADCWLLCMIHASYILNHLSCKTLDGNVPPGMLYGVSPDIASSCSTLSTNQCFMPPTINLTPLLLKDELHVGLDLESMLVMLSLTSFLMMTPRKSSTDLLLDLQILHIPTRDWYQTKERAPRPPNPLSLPGLGKIIVNLHGRIQP